MPTISKQIFPLTSSVKEVLVDTFEKGPGPYEYKAWDGSMLYFSILILCVREKSEQRS